MAESGRNNPRPKSKAAEERERIKAKESAEAEKLHRSKRLKDEIFAVGIIAFGVLVVLSLHTELIGAFGTFTASVLFGIFGRVAYVLAYFLILWGILIFLNKTSYISTRTLICALFFFISICLINAALVGGLEEDFSFKLIAEAYKSGREAAGVFGAVTGNLLYKLTGPVGIWIIGICGILITLMFIIDTPISVFFDNLKIKRAAIRNARKAQMEENEKILAEDKIRKELERKAEEAAKLAAAEAEKQRAIEAAKAAEEKLRQFEQINDDGLPRFNPDFRPESLGPTSQDSEYSGNQQQILEYVTDDTLFGQPEEPKEGYGLHASPFPESAPGSVLDDNSHKKEVSPPKKSPAAGSEKAEGKEPAYRYPPMELLNKPSETKSGGSAAVMSRQAQVLEETLASFGVSATVVDMVKGPSVTRFEVHPAAGVKVSKIVSLQDDLALNLKAKSLRIEAPIPGKAAVGIEISNDVATPVLLREVMESREFRSAKSKISVALGKNVTGSSVVANLSDMPHLLIAGATGSGKSVCINSMILSLLYKASPEEVRLILIDPKVVELSIYKGIPHLLMPVVTEPAKASAALGWAVSEMNERYNKFAEESVRDLQSYNETVRANGEEEKVLPNIIIIIDELADLIMSAQNAVEDSICRIAQKARATGMHLIIATQRPSVDVITGVIKANIPSRIAFAVSSQVDSRTILDMGGAEKLLGKGDMLYYPQGKPKPERIQACFVSEGEVVKVIDFLRENSQENEYDPEVIKAVSSGGSQSADDYIDEEDELLPDAIECVVRAEQASVSMLQRRFRIGYNRAARLMDSMQERGIVGPADGSRPRKVMLSPEQFEELQSQSLEATEDSNWETF